MKNKKVLMLLTLLIVIFLLGIGYAMANINITISGFASATALDENFIVRFKKTGTSFDQPTGMVNATGTITSEREATINVTGLKKVNDEATITYTVENVSKGLDANVTAIPTVTSNEYFEVTTTGLSTQETKISTGDSATVTVTVKLIKTPIEDKSENITIKLTATPIEK